MFIGNANRTRTVFNTRAWPSPPTDNEAMLYRYRKGGVIAREIVASRAQAPPTFCTEATVAKGGGGVFAGHYGIYSWLSVDLYNFRNYPQITCLPQPIDNQHKTSKTTKTGCGLQLCDPYFKPHMVSRISHGSFGRAAVCSPSHYWAVLKHRPW